MLALAEKDNSSRIIKSISPGMATSVLKGKPDFCKSLREIYSYAIV
ncbi:hypothetical protein SEHO0A_01557 [Salmonella enterica subsp. houtenae str. ATCC BAA-1581]|nr:hypothetical protein SEHO0A_01557 [Salmonella enterica subsp. houtenae str. ATCC BAA-1581]ENZ87756.1 hypothetical protein D088_190008 [Salmonella enterica subsp. houtenae serovar 16:z4,z32:-- str. RKS3027]